MFLEMEMEVNILTDKSPLCCFNTFNNEPMSACFYFVFLHVISDSDSGGEQKKPHRPSVSMNIFTLYVTMSRPLSHMLILHVRKRYFL